MIKYLYTSKDCPNCERVKNNYDKQRIIYVERDASRIKSAMDKIDEEALVQASMQNMELPVEVNYGD